MKAVLLGAFAFWQAVAVSAPSGRTDAMRYERALHVARTAGQACAVLDGQIYAHAAPSLADMRIFAVGQGDGVAREIPYAVTESEAVTQETQAARMLNLASMGGKISFDLEMPQRAYTDVRLELDPAVENFVATATVTGANALRGEAGTALGSFSLFDLTAQHLSRETTLPLEETAFRFLHVVMDFANAPGAEKGLAARFAPGIVLGAEVPPSREGQILYTTVAETSAVAVVGRESRTVFELPARVPVERVSVVLARGFEGNFGREVRVTAVAERADGDARGPLVEALTGTILRVRATEEGRVIRREELGVPAILGANLQRAAKVTVAVENGDDGPLPIAAVKLEMRQREICFDASTTGGGGVALYYGDPGLAGPMYEYEQVFSPSEKAVVAALGPERLNAAYRARVEGPRPFSQRHPGVVWAGLMAVICALGLVVVRPSRGCKG